MFQAMRCLLVACTLLFACSHSATLVPRGGFLQPLGREHPLTGKIWSPSQRSFVTPAELTAALNEATLLLLGETHDNADHHRLEAELLEVWLKSHLEARVAFEMLDETQGPALTPPPRSAYELAARVNWQESGWPDFELYRPVFETTLAYGGRVVAAHPSREHVRAAMRGALTDEERAMGLDRTLPAPQQAGLADEIRESHCGYAPSDVLEPMMRAQTYKDAFMARVVAESPPTALVAGRGHVRRDRGVPFHLTQSGQSKVLSIALLDVDDEHTEPSAYDVSTFDFVVFTPRVSDLDPCARFKEQLEQLKKSHAVGGN